MKKISHKIYKNKGNEEVVKHVPNNASPVLDVGCGAGDNAQIIAKRGCIVDGITASSDEAEIASEHCRNVYVHDLESGIPKELKDKKYECVICSHVIEHLRNPHEMLEEVCRVMKKRATLIAAIPNVVHYKNRFKILVGRFEYEKSGIMDNTHYKFYTYKSAQKLLDMIKLDKVESYADGGFPLSRILPDDIESWIDRLSCKMFPGLFGRQIVLIYEKVEY